MKLVRGLLMLLIGAFILLHGIIPHVHFETEDTASLHSHTCRINLLEDIQISLGLDQGSGHFEHYVDNDSNKDLAAVPNVFRVFPTLLIGSSNAELISTLFNGETVQDDHLRGPPLGA